MSNASANIDHSDKLSEDEKQLVRPPLVLNQREMGWISSYISSIVEGKTPTSYTMDHSAGSYTFDAQGKVRLFNRYGMGAEALAHDFKLLLK